jgi:hypothetical protein
MQIRLLALACLLAATGCNANKKICEHAYSVVLKDTQRQAELMKEFAPPEDRAADEERGKKQVAAVQQHFMEKCMELDDEGITCMKRIDDLKKIEEEETQRAEVCFRMEDRQKSDECIEKLRAEHEERVGNCREIMKGLLKSIDAF